MVLDVVVLDAITCTTNSASLSLSRIRTFLLTTTTKWMVLDSVRCRMVLDSVGCWMVLDTRRIGAGLIPLYIMVLDGCCKKFWC